MTRQPRRNHKGLNYTQDAVELIQAGARTREFRDRLLRGDPLAATLVRKCLHLTYWEHRGRQLLPRDAQDTAPGAEL